MSPRATAAPETLLGTHEATGSPKTVHHQVIHYRYGTTAFWRTC